MKHCLFLIFIAQIFLLLPSQLHEGFLVIVQGRLEHLEGDKKGGISQTFTKILAEEDVEEEDFNRILSYKPLFNKKQKFFEHGDEMVIALKDLIEQEKKKPEVLRFYINQGHEINKKTRTVFWASSLLITSSALVNYSLFNFDTTSFASFMTLPFFIGTCAKGFSWSLESSLPECEKALLKKERKLKALNQLLSYQPQE